MTSYYNGDLEKDLDSLQLNYTEHEITKDLDVIGRTIGYGRTQQIVQILWAKYLRESGYPTIGALLPDDLEK